MKKKIVISTLVLSLIQIPLAALAEEGEDILVTGLELDKVLNLGSALLATLLFILTLMAYDRKKSERLLYVSAAFLLFAVKGFLLSMEILFGDWGWVDPTASVLDFAILLSFFFGILRK